MEKGSYYGLTIGDLNADGNFDIFAGSYRRGVRIFLGDGRGDFSRIPSPTEVMQRRAKGQKQTAAGVGEFPRPEKDRSFWQVLALDLDQDGRDDILAGSLDSQGISAWRSLGRARGLKRDHIGRQGMGALKAHFRASTFILMKKESVHYR